MSLVNLYMLQNPPTVPCAEPVILIDIDIQYENRHKVTAVPVQLTEKCTVLVLAMYGGARRMHAGHARPLV